MVGKTLGHYEILELLGKGGMGEVYRARDPKLERDVAIKLLPAELAEDPERLARFEREAKAIAAIDPPSIVTIYSVEHAAGIHFITTQLIAGKTLEQVMSGSGFPLDKFFELAIPLADALASAHDRGIAHRDLKPANVMVTAAGRVKVVDFGLAKLSAPDDDEGPLGTALETLTEEGKILGTVAYMSPEQAEGKPIDHRTDIFSLGVLLYEMASGAQPFQGDTKMSTLSAIIREQPEPLTSVKPGLPRHLGRIVNHALQKDPERRFQSAKDLRNELEALRDEMSSGALDVELVAETVQRAEKTGGSPQVAGAAVALLVGLGAGYFVWGSAAQPQADNEIWITQQLTHLPGTEAQPAISPDGQTVVYAGDAEGSFDIYTRRVSGVNAFNLTANSPGDDLQPAFSADGERIVFRSERDGGGIFIMGATGEQVRKVAAEGFNPGFSPDGSQVVASSYSLLDPRNVGPGDLFVVDIDSGERRELLSGSYAFRPQWSPGGGRIAYFGSDDGQRDIWTIAASGGESLRVTDAPSLDWNPVWSADGSYLYFASDRAGGTSAIWRVAIDENTGEVRGDPKQVSTSESMQGSLSLSRAADTLAYVSRREIVNVRRVAFDPNTGALAGEPELVTQGSRIIWFLGLSPDGQRLAFTTAAPQEDLHTMSIDGSEQNQITNDTFRIRKPRWSPDGETLLFYTNRDGTYEIWTMSPTGGAPRKLAGTGAATLMDPAGAPDGRRFSFFSIGSGTSIMDVDPQSGVAPLMLPSAGSAGEPNVFRGSSWSPDGTRIAGYTSAGGSPRQVLTVYSLDTETYEFFEIDDERAASPVWLADSRYLVVIGGDDRLVLVDTESGDVTELLSVAPDVLAVDIAVSQDSRWIYFIRREVEADLYLLTRAR